MTAAALLETLQRRGISARVECGDLKLKPVAALDAALIASIRCNKSELLELLALETASRETAATSSTRCEARECLPGTLYDPARAFEEANRLHRLGRIDADQRDALRGYALDARVLVCRGVPGLRH